MTAHTERNRGGAEGRDDGSRRARPEETDTGSGRARPEETDDARIEREARSRCGYSVDAAIGRIASEGFLKGASPIPQLRQVELDAEHYLETHLLDSPGALRHALILEIRQNSHVVGAHLDDPLQALAKILEPLLGADARLEQFVTLVDATWGRLFAERPMFEGPSRPADPEDPYTIEGVRTALQGLRAHLKGDSAR